MRHILIATLALLFAQSQAWSQGRLPGEDPVVLERKPSYPMLPLGTGARSSAADQRGDMPDWQRAKASRYQAKSFAQDRGNVLTERDVINAATDDGFKTTCTQNVGSAVLPRGIVAAGNEQVVVLRGDLVNICN